MKRFKTTVASSLLVSMSLAAPPAMGVIDKLGNHRRDPNTPKAIKEPLQAKLEEAKKKAFAGEDPLKKFVDKAKDVGEKVVDKAKDVGEKVVDKAKDVGEKVVDEAKDVGEKVVDKAKDVGERVVDKAKDIGGKVIDKAEQFGRKIGDEASRVIHWVEERLLVRAGQVVDEAISSAKKIRDDIPLETRRQLKATVMEQLLSEMDSLLALAVKEYPAVAPLVPFVKAQVERHVFPRIEQALDRLLGL